MSVHSLIQLFEARSQLLRSAESLDRALALLTGLGGQCRQAIREHLQSSPRLPSRAV